MKKKIASSSSRPPACDDDRGENEQRMLDFQKNHSVAKAAEVLQLFERLAAKDSKINL